MFFSETQDQSSGGSVDTTKVLTEVSPDDLRPCGVRRRYGLPRWGGGGCASGGSTVNQRDLCVRQGPP